MNGAMNDDKYDGAFGEPGPLHAPSPPSPLLPPPVSAGRIARIWWISTGVAWGALDYVCRTGPTAALAWASLPLFGLRADFWRVWAFCALIDIVVNLLHENLVQLAVRLKSGGR